VIGEICGLCWRLSVRAVLPAEIEVANKHRHRKAHIFKFLAKANRATGEPARERPHRQVWRAKARSKVSWFFQFEKSGM